MSSDTTKDSASVVDSSATVWKQEMGNTDDPDTPRNVVSVKQAMRPMTTTSRKHSKTMLGCIIPCIVASIPHNNFNKESLNYKDNDDGDPCRAEEVGQFRDHVGNATSSGKLYNTRYFIIKSLNYQNIQLSIDKGIWATQVMNEPILEEAFRSSDKVIFIFSVNMSGFFQGYAQMMSSVGWSRDDLWSQGRGKCNPWGRSFKVKWSRLNDLPFQKTLHLKNPLNDFKPVKISRDCQELSPGIGEALCELLDGKSDFDGLQASNFPRNDFSSQMRCLQPLSALGDEACNDPPMHLSWSLSPKLHSSPFYQHQADSSRYRLASQRSSGIIFPEKLPDKFAALKLRRTKESHLKGSLSGSRMDRVVYPQVNEWGLYAESTLDGDLTEDDFLEMSYEEYLEFQSRSRKGSCPPASERSQTSQDSSSSRKRDDHSYSDIGTDRPCSKNRAHYSYQK